MYNKQYLYNIGDVVNNLKVINQIRINKNSKSTIKIKAYTLKCSKCEYIVNMSEGSLKDGRGCSVCASRKVIKGINDIATTHPQLIKYFANIEDVYKYSFGSNKKVNTICPICGSKKVGRIADITINFSCDFCGDGRSYPNKVMSYILYNLNINYISEFSPKWCKFDFNNKNKTGKYDFYFEINNKNYIIEMDGKQHKNGWNDDPTDKISQNHIDSQKDKLAMLNNVKVIRINCEKSNINFIKEEITKSQLFEIINLDEINWCECDIFAHKNILKEVCDLWNSGNYTVEKICCILKISRSSACIYLNKGNELKLCNYNGKSEQKKGALKGSKNQSKKVICVNTNKIYNSIKEASEDTDVNGQNISQCCNNKRKSAGRDAKTNKKLIWRFC